MGLFFQALGSPVLLFSSFPSPAKAGCAQNAPGTDLNIEDGQGVRGGRSCKATCGYGAVGRGVRSDMQIAELGSPMAREVGGCLPGTRVLPAGRQQHGACSVCVLVRLLFHACVCMCGG